MTRPTLLVTGDPKFINRYEAFLEALDQHFAVTPCPIPDAVKWRPRGILTRVLGRLIDRRPEERNARYMRLQKSRYAFLTRSRLSERIIRNQKSKPDFILHIYGMFAPFVAKPWATYAMWLDYTMSLAYRNYRPWAPFGTAEARRAWLECERQAYSRAHHVFAASEVVRRSVIEDYGISSDRVTVVGGAGGFRQLYQGPKTFGSRRCLFNGSDFRRKGGDVLLQAWPEVRKNLPEATLVMVGNETDAAGEGIENLGIVSSRQEMQELFLGSDLVLAPARCDPFPTFLLEAVNFGVPGVVSHRDAMPEIIIDGLNGRVIKTLEAPAIASAVVDLLTDPPGLARLSERAREAARRRFNWDTVTQKISRLLKN